jgi:hypothetical protein
LLFFYCYGLEELTPMDYFFLYDNYKNRANVMCVSVWHKFDYAKVRAQFIERAFRFPRMKQRLVRKFGSYCW